MAFIPNFDYWFLQTLAMMLTAFFLPRLQVSGPIPAFATVFTLSYINSLYWDAELFASLPMALTLQTVVLFLINGALFWLVVKLLPGIEVSGILAPLVAPLVFTITSALLNTYLEDVHWMEVITYGLEWLKQLRGEFSGPHTPV